MRNASPLPGEAPPESGPRTIPTLITGIFVDALLLQHVQLAKDEIQAEIRKTLAAIISVGIGIVKETTRSVKRIFNAYSQMSRHPGMILLGVVVLGYAFGRRHSSHSRRPIVFRESI